MSDDVTRNARTALVVAALLSVILPAIPFVSVLLRPLVWLQTFAHESGHGLTALLLGADTFSLRVFADGSGTAPWRAAHLALPVDETAAIVAAGGLVGPAVAA